MILKPSAFLSNSAPSHSEETVVRFHKKPKLHQEELFLDLSSCNIDERSQNLRRGTLAKCFEEVPYRLLMLTVNGLIVTCDNKAVFHKKNGGYSPGALHAFGGHVGVSDFQSNNENERSAPLERAVLRELSEETGIEKENLKVLSWFGPEPYGLSPLWDYGTCGIAALVRTPYKAKDINDKLRTAKSKDETLNQEIVMFKKTELWYLEKEKLHPQLSSALSGIDLSHYL